MLTDLIIISLIVSYLLIGFQFGVRVFWWARTTEPTRWDFFIALVLFPIIWPALLLAYMFMCDTYTLHEVVFHNCELPERFKGY
jgi:hypothetical protein